MHPARCEREEEKPLTCLLSCRFMMPTPGKLRLIWIFYSLVSKVNACPVARCLLIDELHRVFDCCLPGTPRWRSISHAPQKPSPRSR